MNNLTIPDSSHEVIDALIQARRVHRRRKNPVGSDSYLALLPEAASKKIRSSTYFPGAAKAEGAASPGYTSFFFEFTGVAGTPPRPIKGLHAYLNEYDARDREYGKKDIEVWSGGYARLKEFGGDHLKDAFGESYDMGNLVPWSPENPMGTGIWRAIAERLRSGQVRGDEAAAAVYLLQEMSKVLRGYAAGKLSIPPARVKAEIGLSLAAILTLMFGTDDAATVRKLNAEGIRLLEADLQRRIEKKEESAAKRAAQEARKEARAGGAAAPAVGRGSMDALERWREQQRAARAAMMPSVAPAPSMVMPSPEAVRSAAAAPLVPPRTATDLKGAIYSQLLATGLSPLDAVNILSMEDEGLRRRIIQSLLGG